MLIENPQLLLFKDGVNDYSNRTFKNITAFQLACWYLDWRMWKIIKIHLSKAEAEKQLQEHIFAKTPYKKMQRVQL